ncbi:hypothetical protein QE152_g10582 [Popillia japonica]|uniref:Polyprotein n=1 Tax=Popillia japonica TaxID=7064 RepID=A0AAW1LVW0_POPJA
MADQNNEEAEGAQPAERNEVTAETEDAKIEQIENRQLRNRENIQPSARYRDVIVACAAVVEEPQTYEEAKLSNEMQQWQEAMEEEIYMEQPQGFTEGDLVCKLQRSIYGVKQSPQDSDEKNEMSNKPHREAVGSLMFATVSRPDIMFAVNQCLQGTKNIEIRYNGDLQLTIYSDADFAGDCDTRRSTTGYVSLLATGPVTWSSHRQKCVTKSTAEAEYIAASDAVAEIVWLRNFLKEIKISQFLGLGEAATHCNDINSLKALIVQLQDDVRDLKSINSLRTADVTTSKSFDLEEIIAEISDRERRKCNLIIFGIEEQDFNKPRTNRIEGDKTVVTEILNSLHNVELSNVASVRLGKYRQDKKRPIKITFPSEQDVHAVIKNTKKLCQSGVFQNVIVTTDCTPKQL